jgi:hypothetical protein
MNTSLILCCAAAAVLIGNSIAPANPAMLPKHPGYPMAKSVDPVNGQPLANDHGQKSATVQEGLADSALFDDGHSRQNLPVNEDNYRIVEKPGAGLLPKVQGPPIRIEPPVKEGTKVNAAPQ